MQKEPTIHQIEKLIKAFRQNGGNDADISLVAQDIIREFAPEKVKPAKEIFTNKKDDHESIKKIKSFKDDKSPIGKRFIKDIWAKKSFKYPFIFVLCFALFFGVLNFPLVVAKLKPINTETKYETVNELVTPTMDKSAALEPGEVISANPTLVVPKISVTAPILFVNSINENEIQKNLSNGIVHYFGTANPGETGNSFLTGHSSNFWWDKGAYNYIFANLDKLAVGDQAKIYYNGNKYVYQVKNIKVVEPTDVSVLTQTDTPTLTLMTCTPPGTSWKRLIVQFDQIAPAYKAPVMVEKKKPIEAVSLPKSDSNSFLDWIFKLFGN